MKMVAVIKSRRRDVEQDLNSIRYNSYKISHCNGGPCRIPKPLRAIESKSDDEEDEEDEDINSENLYLINRNGKQASALRLSTRMFYESILLLLLSVLQFTQTTIDCRSIKVELSSSGQESTQNQRTVASVSSGNHSSTLWPSGYSGSGAAKAPPSIERELGTLAVVENAPSFTNHDRGPSVRLPAARFSRNYNNDDSESDDDDDQRGQRIGNELMRNQEYRKLIRLIEQCETENATRSYNELIENMDKQRKIVFDETVLIDRGIRETQEKMKMNKIFYLQSKTDPKMRWAVMSNDSTILVIRHGSKFYYWQISQTLGVLIIFTMIVIGNTSILMRLKSCGGRRRRSNVNYFIVQLAIADLLVGIFSVTLDFLLRIQKEFSYGLIACRASKYISGLFIYSSTNLLVALSIDRWEAVVKPLAFTRNRSRGYHLAIGAWLIAMVSAAPGAWLSDVKEVYGVSQCWIQMENVGWRWYMVYLTSMLLVIPVIIIAICYIHIVYTIWSKGQLVVRQQEEEERQRCLRGLQRRQEETRESEAESRPGLPAPGRPPEATEQAWRVASGGPKSRLALKRRSCEVDAFVELDETSSSSASPANLEAANNASSSSFSSSSNRLRRKQRKSPASRKRRPEMEEDNNGSFEADRQMTATSQGEEFGALESDSGNSSSSGSSGRSSASGASSGCCSEQSEQQPPERQRSLASQANRCGASNEEADEDKEREEAGDIMNRCGPGSGARNGNGNSYAAGETGEIKRRISFHVPAGLLESDLAKTRDGARRRPGDKREAGFKRIRHQQTYPSPGRKGADEARRSERAGGSGVGTSVDSSGIAGANLPGQVRLQLGDGVGGGGDKGGGGRSMGGRAASKRNSSSETALEFSEKPRASGCSRDRGKAIVAAAASSNYVTHQHGSGVIPKARIKTIKMTLVIVAAYILCWSPFCILNLCSVFKLIDSSTSVMNALMTLTQSLAHLNSAVNPIIFWLFSSKRSSASTSTAGSGAATPGRGSAKAAVAQGGAHEGKSLAIAAGCNGAQRESANGNWFTSIWSAICCSCGCLFNATGKARYTMDSRMFETTGISVATGGQWSNRASSSRRLSSKRYSTETDASALRKGSER